MTRKVFLKNMVKSIFGYSIIDYKKDKQGIITYQKAGTLIKDCTYTLHYRNRIIELINPIFCEMIKTIRIENMEEPLEMHRNNAKNFIVSLINDTLGEKTSNSPYQFLDLNLEQLGYIYQTIIIKEIFNVKECEKERADESFDDSINIIVNEIIKYYSYELQKQKFINAISDEKDGSNGFNTEIFYKSSELGERFADIKEYLESKKYDFIVLNNHDVTKFQQNTIYRYTGECFFELGKHDEYIIYFNYNNHKIQSYTSKSRWLNQSIFCDYAYTESSRFFNCYFLYDQGRMFKFLQISEADINAEI